MKNVHSGVRPLVIQLLATSFMTGLIWFVQVVHYPLMEGWPHDDFGSWEAAHREHTGPVVIPPMLIEGVVAVWAAYASATGCQSIFTCPRDHCLTGNLGKHVFSSGAMPFAALYGAGMLKHTVFLSRRIGFGQYSGHSAWPFLQGCFGSFGCCISQLWPILRLPSRTPNLPVHSRITVVLVRVWPGRLLDVYFY